MARLRRRRLRRRRAPRPGGDRRRLPGRLPIGDAVITDNLDALVAHLRWPTEHRNRIRSTNLPERTFVEVQRRTKVIGRFPGDSSALSLIWAVLELSSRGWRGVVMTPRSVAGIERLRRRQHAATTEEVTAA